MQAERVSDRVLLSAALLLITFLALALGVTQHRLDGLDQAARALVHPASRPLLQSSMETASLVGGRPGQIVIVCIGSLLLWRRRRRWGVALPVVMAGAGALQLLAKWAIDRPRPNLDAWGFPSAHVLSLAVLCGYLAYVFSSSEARRRWRAPSMGVAATIVATVAFSRMYLDAHWLSDILGGLCIGLAYLLAAVWVIGAFPARIARGAT